MPSFADANTIKSILTGSRTIAIVGLSPKPDRDSNRVARYLLDHGYDIIPVNPVVDEVFGKKSYPTLKDIPEKVDVVDVFRRPEEVPAIAEEAAAIGAKSLWLQLGVVNDEAAQKAADAGLQVVMDRCIKIEHTKQI